MIGSTLKQLLDRRGMRVNELARRVDVPAQTLYSIIKRDNMKIDFEVLLKICDVLEVPVAFFCCGGDAPQMPSRKEWELVRSYRGLDEHGKSMAALVIEAEARRMHDEAEQSDSDMRIIPLYFTPAAAGYASPALGEDYDEYSVPASSKADFAARIQGDSMEPVIADGSVVLVSREPVRDGDVGLFFVDGDMKCKQYCRDNFGNIYLFSLNRARADADVTVTANSGITVCCFGKVLLHKRPALPVK